MRDSTGIKVRANQRTASTSSTFVIIGAGLSGAAAAWRLAQSGADVVVVERDIPASALGSSHGSARIFRYAYPDRFYTGLVVQAKHHWDELEGAWGERLITPSGAVDFGAVRDPHGLAHILDAADVDHEIVTSETAKERWPQLNFDTDVLWHPGAGVIDAETSVEAMLQLAQSAGATVLTGWEAREVRRRGAGYAVTSTKGQRLSAGQVIVATGGWLPALLGELDLPSGFIDRMPEFEVREENAFHFPYRDDNDRGQAPSGQATSWPTFIYKGDNIQAYGLPGGRDAGFRGQKVAEYNGGRVIDSARDQDGAIDPRNRDRVVRFVSEYLPGAAPDPYAETTCLFTNVPRDDMLIDRSEGITIVSPCSGQGAKFAPLIGELVADLTIGSQRAAERFRASSQRFAAA